MVIWLKFILCIGHLIIGIGSQQLSLLVVDVLALTSLLAVHVLVLLSLSLHLSFDYFSVHVNPYIGIW